MNLEDIFKKLSLCRNFELKTAQVFEDGKIPGPIYLSVGQEAVPAVVSEFTKGFTVFAQHRGHSIYLSHGGNITALIDELLGFETGCCGGKGGSPCIQDLSIPMYGHHGLIGENIPLATGYALATQKPTLAYFGDAAAEEDYALTSFGFAATNKLPILYVCEDNDLSILTPTEDRRTWSVFEVAKKMGLSAIDISDELESSISPVSEIVGKLPAFINIKTCRHLWHAGTGVDGPPSHDRYNDLKNNLKNGIIIDEQIKQEINSLWEKRLQKL